VAANEERVALLRGRQGDPNGGNFRSVEGRFDHDYIADQGFGTPMVDMPWIYALLILASFDLHLAALAVPR
jgi:hypothetical protein